MPNNRVYLIYKSIGPSSFACVNQLRKSLGAEKAGHIGTLDPFAEGLLPVFVDRATRLIPYLDEGTKTYRALVVLGASSSSLDTNGVLTSRQDLSFQTYYELVQAEAERIKMHLSELVGSSQQEIPLYSAKKVKGKRLYEYARANQVVEKQYKTVEVTAAKLLNWQGLISQAELNTQSKLELEQLYNERFSDCKQNKAWLYPNFFPQAKPRLQSKKLVEPLASADLAAWCAFTPALYLELEFSVSRGTFIRALVRDLGQRLGTEACTLRLLRTQVGSFSLQAARSEAEWQALFTQVVNEKVVNEKVASEKVASAPAATEQTESERLRDDQALAELGIDLSTVFANLPLYACNEQEYRYLLQGRSLSFYPESKAERREHSLAYLQAKLPNLCTEELINLPATSIIEQRQLVLATYEGQVVGLLNLQASQSTGLSLVPERMLFSHEDL